MDLLSSLLKTWLLILNYKSPKLERFSPFLCLHFDFLEFPLVSENFKFFTVH